MLRSKGGVSEGIFEEMILALGLGFAGQVFLCFRRRQEAREASDHRPVQKERWVGTWQAVFCADSEMLWKFLTQDR